MGLDRRIAVVRLPTPFAGRHGLPDHGGIEPDRHRAAMLESVVIGGPVPGLVAGGCGFAHALQLPRGINEMNPSCDLCKSAPQIAKMIQFINFPEAAIKRKTNLSVKVPRIAL